MLFCLQLNAWTWPTLPPSDKPTTTQIRVTPRHFCIPVLGPGHLLHDRRPGETLRLGPHRCTHQSSPRQDGNTEPLQLEATRPGIPSIHPFHHFLEARHSYVCVYHWRQIKYSRPGRLWGGTKEDVTMPVTETELVEMEADIEHVEDFSGPVCQYASHPRRITEHVRRRWGERLQ